MIVYIDALALLYRSYHAIPNLATADGTPTGALFGFVSSLLRVVAELQPEHVVACFDRPEETVRQEAYGGYKASREMPEEDLIEQIEAAKKLLIPLGVHVVEKAGYEADDLLGTLAVQAAQEGNDAVIVTCDGDLLQLVVNKKVRVYFLRKGMSDFTILDAAAVEKKNGYPANRIIDYKGLSGDASDAIPGVAGIGDTYAKRLIAACGGLDDIYRALDDGLLQEKGFTKRVETLLAAGRESAFLSRDLATIHTDVPGVSVSYDVPWQRRVEREEVLALFAHYDFTSLTHRLISLISSGEEKEAAAVVVPEDPEDTIAVRRACIALWVLDATKTNASLQDVFAYTKENTIEQAHARLLQELERNAVRSVWDDIENPLLPVVMRMEEVGIRFDVAGAQKMGKVCSEKIAALEKAIYRHAGKEFNVSSPKQLSAILYDDLDLKPKRAKKTQSGWKTTKESALLQIIDTHPIIEAVLSYRHYTKLHSTYITALPSFVDSGGRIHTELLQNGTESGRFSSQNPNLQNIPASGDDAIDIRNLFLATDGWTMVAIDYVQFELRIAALLSKDASLLQIFSSGGDIHQAVAAKVFSVSVDAVTSEQRKHAKTINFGILYGAGARSLQQSLGVSHGDAEQFLRRYKEAFPDLFAYLETIRGEAVREKAVKTAFGRIRPVPEIDSHIPYVRARAERIAMNSVLQGTAADIIKIAMIHIDALCERRSYRDSVRLLLQIHDELLFEVRSDVVDVVVDELVAIMESVYPPDKKPIALPVSVKKGTTWGSVS